MPLKIKNKKIGKTVTVRKKKKRKKARFTKFA
jgi:hypothetical protein